MVELGLSLLLLVGLIFVFARQRRTRPDERVSVASFVIAALLAVVPPVVRLLTPDGSVVRALSLASVCVYLLWGVIWLIRNRRSIAAGWKAETEDDRRRGLR